MIKGIHHFSFSVTDINRTIEFYTKVLGITLRSKTQNENETLGTALFGTKWGLKQGYAKLEIVVMNVGSVRIEFIEYKEPKAQPYHKNPSVAGSAHLAFQVENIEELRRRLEERGVEFHSPIQRFMEGGNIEWKWCYFRDPDGIVLELVEQFQE